MIIFHKKTKNSLLIQLNCTILLAKVRRFLINRIILTCTGKTNPFFRGTSLIQNHSRVCGKKLTDGISGLTGSGSPLHVQEKHFEDAVKICIRRITPACAGKTVFLVQMMKHHQDHPRVCGKSVVAMFKACEMPGSPPRVREKHDIATFFNYYHGITPACAGKANMSRFIFAVSRDHPRMCGKNVPSVFISLTSVGSPPRVREKHWVIVLVCPFTRITPACAGKALILFFVNLTIWDHPRVCGKSNYLINTVISIPGSPPRVREKPEREGERIAYSRITPACAGKASAKGG